MKRLLSAIFTIFFVMGLSGCFQPADKDGMVYHEPAEVGFMNIDGKDVLESGYYGMRFLYNNVEPSYEEEFHVIVYFRNSTDSNVDWEVYVRDKSLPDGFESILDKEKPVNYNEGVEIVSGQWIYVRCISQSPDSDTPPKGSLRASYLQGTGNRVAFTPDQEFKRFVEAHSMYGVPDDIPYYLADVTGDGVDERCTSIIFGSGMVRTITLVYDMHNHYGYSLSGYNYDYSAVGVENGRLIVQESGPNGYGDPTTRVTGTVKINDGELIFVPDI